jgi:GTPase SAR1 family protein
MYILTIVGDNFSGKTALCELWSGHVTTNSYLMTTNVCTYIFENITIYDTPSLERFQINIEICYEAADVILLIANDDKKSDARHLRMSHLYPNLHWILILNGDHSFKCRRRWALEHDIRVFQLNTKTGKNVENTFHQLKIFLEDLPKRHIETLSTSFWDYWPVGAFYSIYSHIISSIFGSSSGAVILSK